MRGDFSRVTFDPRKHFSRVLLQQGRVLLDSDFNEQGDIFAHAMRSLIRDLLGPHAGPANGTGFTLGHQDGKPVIGFGHYYVDGLLVENTPPPPGPNALIAPFFYNEQPGYPFTGALKLEELQLNQNYFFYLDVWEQPVTWLEDGALREVALGGPDTGVRTRIAWRVLAVKKPAGTFKPEEWLEQNLQRHSWLAPATATMRLPEMRAWTDPKDALDDIPCVADPLGGYRGLENQLYRVEIHDGTDPGGQPTFKWSRDNGSIAAAWVGEGDDELIAGGIHDTAHGFSPGQWVEVTGADDQLNGRPGVMLRLVKVERDRLTYDPSSISAPLPAREQLRNPIIRRWDHRDSKEYKMFGGAIVLEEDRTYDLESGIRVSFRKALTAPKVSYASGDYWLITARTATGDIEWPSHEEQIDGQPRKVYDYAAPNGVLHVFAPLALAKPKSGNPQTFDIDPLQRKIIQLWI